MLIDDLLTYFEERGFYVQRQRIDWMDTQVYAILDPYGPARLTDKYVARLAKETRTDLGMDGDQGGFNVASHTRPDGPICHFRGHRIFEEDMDAPLRERIPQMRHQSFNLDALHTLQLWGPRGRMCEVMVLPNK
jgi:hypothetical protein